MVTNNFNFLLFGTNASTFIFYQLPSQQEPILQEIALQIRGQSFQLRVHLHYHVHFLLHHVTLVVGV